MKQEEKDLLLQELCARLPYRICVEHINGFRGILHDITVYFTYNDDDTIKDYLCYTNFFKNEPCKIEFFKPYLYPLSSMPDAQREEYESLCIKVTSECADISGFFYTKDNYYDTVESIDYLYKNHFDYRGLIPMGLALDATGLDIY